MNQTSYFVFGIFQLNLLLRDSMEYMVPNRQFSVEMYDKRKEGFTALTAENSPFGRFLAMNQEKAPKIRESFSNFIDLVYSDNASIVRKIDDKIEVDKGLHLQFYEMTAGLYQTIEDILYGYLAHAQKENQYEESLAKAILANEVYFRSLSYFAITIDIVEKFNEFQTAFRESKGQPSPASNFINEEIGKLVGILGFHKKHSKVKDVAFHDMVDKVNALLETIGGKRQLPEGMKFPDLFKATREVTLNQLQKSETEFKAFFGPILNDYVALTKKITAAQQNKESEVAKDELS